MWHPCRRHRGGFPAAIVAAGPERRVLRPFPDPPRGERAESAGQDVGTSEKTKGGGKVEAGTMPLTLAPSLSL